MINDIIKTAMKQEKPDIVFKNANIVNVFTHSTDHGDVAVKDGVIAGIGSYEDCDNIIDCKNKYLMPSFVDTHVHIESSMLTPGEYAKAVAARGITDVITDPHEIVNVCSEQGLEFMIKDSQSSPVDFHWMLPSCVPATPLDSSGCVIDGHETLHLFKKYGCFGLGEMMNYPGIVGCDPDVLRKLTATSNIDGHAPMITGDGLNAYISAGIRTDHESVTIDEAREKLAKGMYILIREGSNARELAEMVPLINKDFISRIAFCTDDKDMHDINYEGTIDFSINKAIKLGADPVLAITAASYSACSIYGLAHKGAIAPGYKADIVLTDGLNAENILQVYKNGTLIAENGKALFRCEKANTRHVTSTVHIRPLKASDLELEFSPDLTVIQAHKDTLVTSGIHCDTDEGLNTACIIERHKATGRIGKAFVSGFGIQHGAVAQTIGHDSHNICVVGDNAGDMLMAVEALGKDGGIAVVANGEVEAQLSLPVAGLMSDQTMTDALPKFEKVTAALAEISKGAENSLFMSMSFLSLIVIPDVKLTDKGVFDVKEWKFIS